MYFSVPCAALYNSTSIVRTDFRTHFNRLLSIMLFYNQYTRLENMNEIGERVLKEYFPSGSLDDNTHSNAVNVICYIKYLIKYYVPCN